MYPADASPTSRILIQIARTELGCLPALLHQMMPVKSAVLSQPTSQVSNSSHLNEVLELLRKLMEYRSSEVRHRLEKVGREASMLHMDVSRPTFSNRWRTSADRKSK